MLDVASTTLVDPLPLFSLCPHDYEEDNARDLTTK